MSASSWFIGWILLSEAFFCWSEYRRNISAEPGQSVTLPCQHPDNYTLIAVEWSRTDLGDKYVLLYRDQQMDKSYQEPSFSDRVDLQDRLMEDGGVSLVLQDVRTYDTGTYECRVVHSGLSEAKLNNGPVCTIHLDVAPPPPGNKDGNKEDEENLDEGNKDEGNKDEGNKDEGNKDEGNLDEENLDEENLDEGNLDEGNKDEGNKDEGNKDEENKDEGNKEGVKEGSIVLPVFFMILIFTVAFLIVRVRCVRPKIFREMMLKRRLKW